MQKNFKANVNKSYEFDISETDNTALDSVKTSTNSYHILHDNVSYKAEITDSDFNNRSYEVIINNNTYNVNLMNELDLLVKEMGFELAALKQSTK